MVMAPISGMVMIYILPLVSSSGIVQFYLYGVKSLNEVDTFLLNCIRKCQISLDCAAAHKDGQKCENMDSAKYTNMTKNYFSGAIFKVSRHHIEAKEPFFLVTKTKTAQTTTEKMICENGGHIAEKGVTRCVCSSNYTGTRCERFIEDCSEGFQKGSRVNGVYMIQPKLSPSPFEVYCEMTLGGRTYVQKQSTGINFTRTWEEYKHGFGSLKEDHWLGLEKMRQVVTSFPSHLLVYIKLAFNNKQCRYHTITLRNESSWYRLSFSKYVPVQGRALNDCLKDLNGSRFSTWDRDNDGWNGSCAHVHGSGWWFNNCTRCNPNGMLKSRTPRKRKVFWPGAKVKKMFMAVTREEDRYS